MAVFVFALIGISSCSYYEDTLPFEEAAWANEMPSEQYYDIYRSGKRKHAQTFKEIYEPVFLDTLPFPTLNSTLIAALENQLELLDIKPLKQTLAQGAAVITNEKLKEVVQILLDAGYNSSQAKEQLEAYQVWGGDKKGHVKFTGYYTPTLQVRHEPDSTYRYPFYRKPDSWEGPLPTRRQIDGEGALDSLGLEIAYAADPVDVYYTHLQGSAMVEFVDTKEAYLLVYEGSNKMPYKSIEYYLTNESGLGVEDVSIYGIKRLIRQQPHLRDSVLLINPSYSFFQLKKQAVIGAGQVPLTPEISVAVDKRYFPLGATLLVAVPVFDKRRNAPPRVSHYACPGCRRRYPGSGAY
ncbi:MAG: MltA domain-containing protein [Saprospirales bacterium]|nr:MltA domain-containing protein [Saprospirales bacterium]